MGRFLKLKYIILAGLFVFVVMWLLNIQLSSGPTAPGCSSSGGNYFGGCFGKQAIPFQISWSMRRCLKVSANTCSKPDIQLHSTCGEEIAIGDEIYNSDVRYIYLDQTGKSGIVVTSGSVGGKPFYIISYVAAPGCK